MNFEFTDEQKRLRKEVRGFLEDEIRKGAFKPQCDAWIKCISRDFSRKMGQRGWIGITWPEEYGGQGRGFTDRLVVTEELLRYGAPAAGHWMADRQIGASLLAYGSEAQKREFLPQIAKGETIFSVGMSEPEAGSDLASLKTRAKEKKDYFIIDGQKVWTSEAVEADYIYIVARTDPDAPKHRGISEFIVDLNLPGVTRNPLVDMAGEAHFSEVFFDNVKVPKNMLVGEKNRGWYQITPQLDYERSGIERVMANYILFEELINYVKETGRAKDLTVRNKLADLRVEFEVGKLLVYRTAYILDQGKVPNYESALAKTYCTEFEQRLSNVAVNMLGLHGLLRPESKWAPLNGWAAMDYLFAPGFTLQAGTSEILRNVVAIRGLGLPAR